MKGYFRIFILFNFIVLALPFFQKCSDETIMQDISKQRLWQIENSVSSEAERVKVINQEILESQKDLTDNGFEIFLTAISKFSFSDWADAILIPLILIPFITLILFIVSFTNSKKAHITISVINLILTVTELSTFLWLSENISQVKYGMYLLMINSFIILYLSIKMDFKPLVDKLKPS